jgi:hypothetical protein
MNLKKTIIPKIMNYIILFVNHHLLLTKIIMMGFVLMIIRKLFHRIIFFNIKQSFNLINILNSKINNKN